MKNATTRRPNSDAGINGSSAKPQGRKSAARRSPRDIAEEVDYFNFYPRNWLNSQRVRQMSYEQKGVYIDLLAMSAETKDVTIPDDNEAIARLLHMDHAEFMRSHMQSVRALFLPVKGLHGRLASPRLRLEVLKARDALKRRIEQRRNAAKSRWDKDSQNGATAMRPQCDRNAVGTTKFVRAACREEKRRKSVSSFDLTLSREAGADAPLALGAPVGAEQKHELTPAEAAELYERQTAPYRVPGGDE